MLTQSKPPRVKTILLLFALLFLTACSSKIATPEISLEEKIGQLLMVGFRGLSLAENPQLATDLRAGRIGAVVLFDYDSQKKSHQRNIESKPQLKKLIAELQTASPTPLLIAIDQEGGMVSRLKEGYGFPATLSAHELGQKADPKFTRETTEKLAATLSGVGVNLNLAPVVDLCSNPNNPVIAHHQRCFSADPEQVSRQAASYIDAHHQQRILTSLKHFPGHGSSRGDSHKGFVDISSTWSQDELIPFRKLIANNKVDTVMTAHVFNHNLDADYPATLSPKVITGLLRNELGFAGVVISDDLQMRALTDHYTFAERIQLALQAGVDILLFGNNLEYDPLLVDRAQTSIKQLLQSGVISQERIECSYRRIMKLKRGLG